MYDMLVSKSGLVRQMVPLDAAPTEPSIPIFHSPDATTADKLMVIATKS